jgi:mRNA interferase MazF
MTPRRPVMAKPKRGEVWLVDMGYAAKVRPALVLSGPVLDDERALTTVIPHTTSVRGTRLEIPTSAGWLKNGAFDVQGIGTYPTVKLMRKRGDLPEELLGLVESRVVMLLALPGHP